MSLHLQERSSLLPQVLVSYVCFTTGKKDNGCNITMWNSTFIPLSKVKSLLPKLLEGICPFQTSVLVHPSYWFIHSKCYPLVLCVWNWGLNKWCWSPGKFLGCNLAKQWKYVFFESRQQGLDCKIGFRYQRIYNTFVQIY